MQVIKVFIEWFIQNILFMIGGIAITVVAMKVFYSKVVNYQV